MSVYYNCTQENMKSWSKEDPNTGCWEWERSLDKDGYGLCNPEGKLTKAHRHSFKIFKNVDPKGKLVCHSCDNRKCINPDHLWLGTNDDNMMDMVRKGRAYRSQGEKSYWTDLTNEQVKEIKRLSKIHTGYGAYVKIGNMFGITNDHVGKIIRGERWAHIS